MPDLIIKLLISESGKLVQGYNKTVKHLGIPEERFEKHCSRQCHVVKQTPHVDISSFFLDNVA